MAAGEETSLGYAHDAAALEALTLDLIRVATALSDYAARARPAASPQEPAAREVAALIAARRARAAAFGLELAHPGWTLLLELYRARLAAAAHPGRAPSLPAPAEAGVEGPVPSLPAPAEAGVEGAVRIGRLAAAAGVPLTSVLRWLDRLAAAGLAERRADPRHETAALMALTEAGAEAMTRHFTAHPGRG